jgi:hypothetical protein
MDDEPIHLTMPEEDRQNAIALCEHALDIIKHTIMLSHDALMVIAALSESITVMKNK